MTEQYQEHARLAPSGAHGWRRCPGKPNAEAGLPDKVGREAAEGTVFHDAAELCLKQGFEPHDLQMGREKLISGHMVSYNEEMRDNLYEGLEFIYKIISDPEWIYGVEDRVPIHRYTLERKTGFGTSDFWAVNVRKRKIIIFDWKYGKIHVSPIENDQEDLYGLGVWEAYAGKLFDWDARDIDVEFVIWQPRVPDGIGMWPTTMEWLLKEGQQIVIDAAATYPADAPRIPGTKQCMYCKARKVCPEAAMYNANMIGLRFDDIDEKVDWDRMSSPPRLGTYQRWTPERRSYAWLHKDAITRWLKALGEAIMEDYHAQLPTPFIKAIEGNKGDREFAEQHLEKVEAYLENRLGEKAFVPEKLISVAVAEKQIGKKQFEEDLARYLAPRAPGRPILAPITAKKPALSPDMAAFDEIEAEED
jgi:hypothetical protein